MKKRMMKFKYFPKDKAIEPQTGEVLVDKYWFVHPEKGLLFLDTGKSYSKQCNSDIRILKNFKNNADETCAPYLECKIEKITTYWPKSIFDSYLKENLIS